MLEREEGAQEPFLSCWKYPRRKPRPDPLHGTRRYVLVVCHGSLGVTLTHDVISPNRCLVLGLPTFKGEQEKENTSP